MKQNEIALKMKLSAGQWEYIFRNKKNLQPLTSPIRIELIEKETEISINIPKYLLHLENVGIYCKKIR